MNPEIGMFVANASSFMLPPQASTFAASVDNLFNFINILNVIFFVGLMGTTAYFVVKYKRRSADQKTSANRGNHKLEFWWSFIPAVLLLVIFGWGFKDFMRMSVAPRNAMEVRVTGQKWSWAFTYPNGGTDAVLTVPVGEPVRLVMTSVDVLHSFYVPAFRVKRDVIPNRYTVLWFEATTPGTYPVFCTEYCGTDHSRMLATVNVVSREAYENYLSGLGGCADGETIEACGQGVYERAGCRSCHSVDGTPGAGPSFNETFGGQIPLADGTTVTGDETYIRNSIVNPTLQVHQGFGPIMPGNYGQQLKEEQIEALVAFIRSL